MATIVGQKFRVYVVAPDGMVHDISGSAIEMSITHNVDSYTELNMSIIANGYSIGPLDIFEQAIVENVHNTMVTGLWKCPACGNTNQQDAVYCGQHSKQVRGCNSPRPLA